MSLCHTVRAIVASVWLISNVECLQAFSSASLANSPACLKICLCFSHPPLNNGKAIQGRDFYQFIMFGLEVLIFNDIARNGLQLSWQTTPQRQRGFDWSMVADTSVMELPAAETAVRTHPGDDV